MLIIFLLWSLFIKNHQKIVFVNYCLIKSIDISSYLILIRKKLNLAICFSAGFKTGRCSLHYICPFHNIVHVLKYKLQFNKSHRTTCKVTFISIASELTFKNPPMPFYLWGVPVDRPPV